MWTTKSLNVRLPRLPRLPMMMMMMMMMGGSPSSVARRRTRRRGARLTRGFGGVFANPTAPQRPAQLQGATRPNRRPPFPEGSPRGRPGVDCRCTAHRGLPTIFLCLAIIDPSSPEPPSRRGQPPRPPRDRACPPRGGCHPRRTGPASRRGRRRPPVVGPHPRGRQNTARPTVVYLTLLCAAPGRRGVIASQSGSDDTAARLSPRGRSNPCGASTADESTRPISASFSSQSGRTGSWRTSAPVTARPFSLGPLASRAPWSSGSIRWARPWRRHRGGPLARHDAAACPMRSSSSPPRRPCRPTCGDGSTR
jgi:hypothetical protein